MNYSLEVIGQELPTSQRNGQARREGHTRPGAERAHRAALLNSEQHAEKLSDVGARVARVAHELNAPLSLICGSLENLGQYLDVLIQYVQSTARRHDRELARLRPDLTYVVENAPTLMEICRQGTERLAYVIEQVKGYTRSAPGGRPAAKVDLGRVLHEAILFAAQGREGLPTVHEDVPHLPCIPGSAESLSQAFVNVIGNAFDAVATALEPRVWVRAGLDGTVAGQPRWVEIRILDNGPGVTLANRQRIFDAFFTTKPPGSGLGLGLAIAKEIVEGQRGTIALAGANGGGAEFVIRLPAHHLDGTE